jgi:3-oxoacyl-(acyl-carrier-protein) synthase
MSRRRVVVTGLGCISPVGNTVADAWANLLAGQSGIDRITKFDASNFSCQIAGRSRVSMWRITWAPKMRAPWTPSFTLALRQRSKRSRTQAAYGRCLVWWLSYSHRLRDRVRYRGLAPDRKHPDRTVQSRPPPHYPIFRAASIINMVAGHVSMRHGFKGPTSRW